MINESVIVAINESTYISPEDFVVTEIDSEGRLVVLDDFTPPPTPPTPQRPRAGPFGGRREPKRPDVAKVPPLDQLISQEHYQTVSDLAKRFEEDPYLEENVCFGESNASLYFFCLHV